MPPIEWPAKAHLGKFNASRMASKSHEFYNIKENEKAVGYVWMKVVEENKSAFLYEIYLKDEFRSKGIGKKVMIELEFHLLYQPSF